MIKEDVRLVFTDLAPFSDSPEFHWSHSYRPATILPVTKVSLSKVIKVLCVEMDNTHRSLRGNY